MAGNYPVGSGVGGYPPNPGGGGVGTPTRPPLQGDELLIWTMTDASSPLLNTGSASSADLTATGTFTYQSPGLFAPVVNSATVGNVLSGAPAVHAPDTFSASIWFRMTSLSGNQIIFQKADAATPTQLSVNLNLASGNFIYLVQTSNGYFSISLPTTSFVVNQWHYAVLTYDGTKISAYLDGVFMGSAAATGTMIQYPYDWTIGNLGNGSQTMSGDIGEFRLSPSVLSLPAIRANNAIGYGIGP